MQIKVNTDNHIEGTQDFQDHVKAVISKSLSHFSEEITRVEVHVSDENGPKDSGKMGDKRCLIEVRLAGVNPISVIDHNSNLHAAIAGAADKAQRTIGKLVEKRRAH